MIYCKIIVGLLDAITSVLKEDKHEKVSAKAAEVVAHFAADSSSNRKKRASSTGQQSLKKRKTTIGEEE